MTEPGSVKQWLNLCKQALAQIPNCLPAVWAAGLRGTNPLAWARVTHVDVYVCASAEDPSCRMKTWRGIQKALLKAAHTESRMLLGDDG